MRIYPRTLYRLSIALLVSALLVVTCYYQSRLRLLEADYEKLANSEMPYPSFLPVYRSEAANLRFHNRVYKDRIADLATENVRLRAENVRLMDGNVRQQASPMNMRVLNRYINRLVRDGMSAEQAMAAGQTLLDEIARADQKSKELCEP